MSEKNYLTNSFTLRSWLFTTDHKRIALLYLISITLFFFVGGAAAALIVVSIDDARPTPPKRTTSFSPCMG